MKSIVIIFLLFGFSLNAFCQEQTVKGYNSDSLYYYKRSIIKGHLFKVGDKVYSARSLKTLLQDNEDAYESLNAFRSNNFMSGLSAYVFGASIYGIVNGLINRNNIFPFVCITPVTYYFGHKFFKKSLRHREKMIIEYNTRLR